MLHPVENVKSLSPVPITAIVIGICGRGLGKNWLVPSIHIRREEKRLAIVGRVHVILLWMVGQWEFSRLCGSLTSLVRGRPFRGFVNPDIWGHFW